MSDISPTAGLRTRSVAEMLADVRPIAGGAVLTAKQISSVAIELLVRTMVLPGTVARIPGEEFTGSNGDTITVRVPQPGAARKQLTRGATITYDNVAEVPVNVTLAHLYHAKRISDEELSLDLEDFAEQITKVQTAAVATGAENEVAAAMNAVLADASFALTASPADTEAKILAAREALSKADVPSTGRFFAVSPEIATRVLKVDKFVRVNESGSNSALREATIGRLYGFEFVESNGLDPGEAVAYHRTGFAFANRAPAEPRGATESATLTEAGISLRQIFQYAPDILSDASVLSTFAGAALVDADRIFKLDTAIA